MTRRDGRSWWSLVLWSGAMPIVTAAMIAQGANVAPTAALSGVVIDGQSGRPVEGALVTLGGGASGIQTFGGTVTDAKGRFVFTELRAGEYKLGATRVGYLHGSYGSDESDLGDRVTALANSANRIALKEGQWIPDLRIRISRPASIDGTVRGDLAEPLIGRHVRAMRVLRIAGRSLLGVVATAVTDDRGAYSLAPLVKGQYIVSVLPTDSTELALLAYGDSLYPLQFYPRGRVTADAEVLTVRPGDSIFGIDFDLQSVPARRLSGSIQTDVPADTAGQRLGLFVASEKHHGPSTLIAASWSDASGRFAFPRVPAGEYVVLAAPSADTELVAPSLLGPHPATLPQLSAQPSAPTQTVDVGSGFRVRSTDSAALGSLWTRTAVSLTSSDVTDLTIRMQQTVSVRGRLEVDPDGRAPGTEAPVALLLAPADGDVRLGLPTGRWMPERDGRFEIAGVLPGRYVIRMGSAFGDARVKSVTIGGVDYSRVPIDVAEGDVSDLEIRLAMPAAIQGDVTGASAELAEVSVLYFSTLASDWTDFGFGTPRIGMLPVRLDGSFSSGSRIPAGDYFVVAVRRTQAERWHEPKFLAAASRTARRISLGWGQKMSVDVAFKEVD